jgi:hypothetical protein
MLRRREDPARIENLGPVVADDELQEHVARVVRESLAALRRTRQLTQRPRRRLIWILVAGVSIVAGVLLFRRLQAHQAANRDSDGVDDPSGEWNMPTEWETPIRPVEDIVERSEAATAAEPVFTSAPGLATEPIETSAQAWDEREGSVVFDRDGEHVGRLQSTYFDSDTGTAEWALVSFGSVRLSLRFVPLRNARFVDDRLHLDFSSEQIHNAPDIDADGHVSQEEEDSLYAHYALERTGAVSFTRNP